MTPPAFDAEQRAVWSRVEELWRLATDKDAAAITAALHPRYVGWEAGAASPHDRETAVRSVVADDAGIVGYELDPVSVEVYDGRVGVAHYRYAARVATGSGTESVNGRWTEVYLRHGGQWLMISVCGGPRRDG